MLGRKTRRDEPEKKTDCRTCPAASTCGTETETSGKLRGKLADLDSNQDKQIQNLLCYRYTIGQ